MDFALLWGLTAFLCNYIPNLGSLLGSNGDAGRLRYNRGMKLKTSVTLSEDLLKRVDGMARKGEPRSQVLERLLREALDARARAEVEQRDRTLLNRHAEALNAEVDDVLGYQVDL